MRTIERQPNFKRDYKRESNGKYKDSLDNLLAQVLIPLAQDEKLADKFRDHPLRGKLRGYRECHIKPDLLLIYRKPNNDLLELYRLGSHSELRLT